MWETGFSRWCNGNLNVLGAGAAINGSVAFTRFFGLAGAEVASYAGDKEAFIGRCNGYGNPVGVENGDFGNCFSYNDNSCGALSGDDELTAPGERKKIAFILG